MSYKLKNHFLIVRQISEPVSNVGPTRHVPEMSQRWSHVTMLEGMPLLAVFLKLMLSGI